MLPFTYLFCISSRLSITTTMKSEKLCKYLCLIFIAVDTISLARSQSNFNQTIARMSTNKIVSFDEVQQATKNNKIYIIDVREPDELKESGAIPHSINIPLSAVENVLKNYDAEQFEKEFGRSKPTNDALIIFSCRSGKRANIAMEKAMQIGFQNTQLYEGSWLDWETHMKK